MTNRQIAEAFERVARMLDLQGATPFRANAWRAAAESLREQPRQAVDIYHTDGRTGLEAIPHVGARLSSVIVELIKTGTCAALERLQGDPVHTFASIPVLGPTLAERIHEELGIDSLEDLETAAHDGRLEAVDGIGPRRAAALRAVLASRLSRRAAAASSRTPPVRLLLDIDREYRARAAAGTLHKIAPRRFNPDHEAWLPIMHVDRGGFSFTAMFSNTELAHRLERTADWVVIYYYEPHRPESRVTVVTEHQGPGRGQRVVRGRERECLAFADAEPDASRQAG